MRAGAEHHIAATPAIAAVRSSERDQRFAAECRSAVTALSGANDDIYLIYECSRFHFTQTDARHNAERPPSFCALKRF
jgi:hypothetical protein